jgi:hypothetical protein
MDSSTALLSEGFGGIGPTVSSGTLSGFALSSVSCGPGIGGGSGQRGVVGDSGDELGCWGVDDEGGVVVCGVVAGGVVVVAGDFGLGGFADGVVGAGAGCVDGVVLQAANEVAGTKTLLPFGMAHSVPPCTNCTLPLPGGSPAGHCTVWP